MVASLVEIHAAENAKIGETRCAEQKRERPVHPVDPRSLRGSSKGGEP